MVYMFKAIGRDKIGDIDREDFKKFLGNFDPEKEETASGTTEWEIEMSIEPIPGVTLAQAETVFSALWGMTGEIEPDIHAELFEL